MKIRGVLLSAILSLAFISSSCAELSTVLKDQEDALQLGINEREFHSTLYFPKGEALHYPGYVVGIEKSPKNIVGGPSDGNRLAFTDSPYIKGEQAKGLAKTTSEIIDIYENKRKSLFLSHIIRYGAPLLQKDNSASASLIDQCFVYNAFESIPMGSKERAASPVVWHHCGAQVNARNTDQIVQVPLGPGETKSSRNVVVDQFQDAGPINLIYDDGRKALKKLECGLAAHVNAEDFTHLVIIVMGWNTSQDEAIRNFNDIIGNMVEASEDEKFLAPYERDTKSPQKAMRFKPLVLGITWPSYWNKTKWDLASYFDKADDADELGMTWLNVIINKMVPLVLAQPEKKEKDEHGNPTGLRSLPVVLIGHSFGARAAMRALFSGPVLRPPVEKVGLNGLVPAPMVDLAVGLEGAVSVNRFIPDTSAEGAPYRDFREINTKVVLTASEFDEATSLPFWYSPSGSTKVWREECKTRPDIFECRVASDSIKYGQDINKSTGVFTVCPDGKNAACTTDTIFPSEGSPKKILYLNTSKGITQYNTPGTGGGAHSDIYRLPMGRLLWALTKTYAPTGVKQTVLDKSVLDDARTAANACGSIDSKTTATGVTSATK